jgi:formylglycine-generating enzyme required for sulfatase activity
LSKALNHFRGSYYEQHEKHTISKETKNIMSTKNTKNAKNAKNAKNIENTKKTPLSVTNSFTNTFTTHSSTYKPVRFNKILRCNSLNAGGIATLTGGCIDGVATLWYTILEQDPNATVVLDADVRRKIIKSGFPWRVRDNSSGIEMLLVPPGTFTIGEKGWNTPHAVTLTKAFYLGKTVVTQEQWHDKMSNSPSYFTGSANNPVEQVSWNDIAGFNIATGLRLPTEAEWEYACRGGTTTVFHSMPGYPNGTDDDSLLGNIAWYNNNNSPYGTKPVGGKSANAFGLYDMSGNVWEWCQDWYGDYSASNMTTPTEPSVLYAAYRVLRGGSWINNSNNCRSSTRNNLDPDSRYGYVGFRVARTP